MEQQLIKLPSFSELINSIDLETSHFQREKRKHEDIINQNNELHYRISSLECEIIDLKKQIQKINPAPEPIMALETILVANSYTTYNIMDKHENQLPTFNVYCSSKKLTIKNNSFLLKTTRESFPKSRPKLTFFCDAVTKPITITKKFNWLDPFLDIYFVNKSLILKEIYDIYQTRKLPQSSEYKKIFAGLKFRLVIQFEGFQSYCVDNLEFE